MEGTYQKWFISEKQKKKYLPNILQFQLMKLNFLTRNKNVIAVSK